MIKSTKIDTVNGYANIALTEEYKSILKSYLDGSYIDETEENETNLPIEGAPDETAKTAGVDILIKELNDFKIDLFPVEE
ncbi:MAG: hypothetical protein IJ583_08230 [Firmicutes bacterium]|nr:hypothetical protein [Bacillota bacterium]